MAQDQLIEKSTEEYVSHTSSPLPSSSECPICLHHLSSGCGNALFTAECGHVFHFPCIVSNVQHGNFTCPMCRVQWNQVPLMMSSNQLQRPASCVSTQTESLSQEVPSQPSYAIRAHQSTPRTQETRTERRQGPLRRANFSHPCYAVDPREPAVYVDDEPLPPPQNLAIIPHDLRVGLCSEASTNAAVRDGLGGDFGVLITVTASSRDDIITPSPHSPSPRPALSIERPAEGDTCPTPTEPAALGASHTAGSVPVDLVAVVDLSASMNGRKLRLLKEALNFVITSLGADNRIAIVSFAAHACREMPLTRMTEAGQAVAKAVVQGLLCTGGTNIASGLHLGTRILKERRSINPVAAVLLLSDGQDSVGHRRGETVDYRRLLPPSTLRANRGGERAIPVFTFGFGVDHDARAMHTISEETDGVFSFVEQISSVQDAFARCLGGLLTVVAQEVKVTVTCAQGVTIQQVLSGAYRHSLAYDNSETTVSLGEMYAEEKRHLLLDVTINPVTRAMGHPLLTATCTYMGGPQFLLEVHVPETVLSVVEREEGGEGGGGGEEEVAVAVDRERNRLQTAYAIAQASQLAQQGNLGGAMEVLHNTRTTMMFSTAFTAGDSRTEELMQELEELGTGLAEVNVSVGTGVVQAAMLAATSTHSRERSSTRSRPLRGGGEGGENGVEGYETSSMHKMVYLSRTNTPMPHPTPPHPPS